MLRADIRERLLADRGITPTECCDKCGRFLGTVRFIRRGESGVWCSLECRGQAERKPKTNGGGR